DLLADLLCVATLEKKRFDSISKVQAHICSGKHDRATGGKKLWHFRRKAIIVERPRSTRLYEHISRVQKLRNARPRNPPEVNKRSPQRRQLRRRNEVPACLHENGGVAGLAK